MEISGVVLQPVSGFSGAWKRRSSIHLCFSCKEKIRLRRSCNFKDHCFSSGGKMKTADFDTLLFPKPGNRRESGFFDDGHLLYYVSPRSGKSEKHRRKDFPATTTKNKLKLLKGLSKDLSMFSAMSTGDGEGLIDEDKGRMIAEAAEVLLAQLQQLRAEEKEIKRRNKEEKAALKAVRVKARGDIGSEDSSSSSSSESSDSECEVVDMNRVRTTNVAIEPDSQVSVVQSVRRLNLDSHDPSHPQEAIREEEVKPEATGKINLNLSTQEQGRQKVNEKCTSSSASCGEDCTSCCSRVSAVASEASAQKIEVCMGGKCKRSGAVDLLEEFERRIGIEGAVVGCKCMGKCRDGPNVRVLSKKEDGELVKASNPLCIGVGLEDVGVILTNFFEEKEKSLQIIHFFPDDAIGL